jgi:uncharacterized delta-60 repeat protein
MLNGVARLTLRFTFIEKLIMRSILRLSLLLLLVLPAVAQTQLDPGFLAQRIYQPADATAALQLSNGSRIIFGVTRAEHQAVPGLAAYQANGQLDLTFQANLAAATWRDILGAAEAPGGKIWLVAGQAIYGPTTYYQLIRLNADGSRDLSFAPQTTGWGIIRSLVAQPDGKVVVGGILRLPGTTIPIPLLRFNADGTPDTAFNSQVANGPYALQEATSVVLQPDGKLVAAVSSPEGIVRINSNGSNDATFRLVPRPVYSTGIGSLALQPDGKLLVGALDGSTTVFSGYAGHFLRINPNGSLDTSFNAGYWLCPQRSSYILPTVQVRSNGKIVLGVNWHLSDMLPVNQQYVAQLQPNGSLDSSWQFPAITFNATFSDLRATSVQVLASGEVLAAGRQCVTGAALNLPTGVRLLQPNGAVASTFTPLLQMGGGVNAIVLHANGKIVIGGLFSEVNGVATRSLACLNPDGSVDAAFMAGSPFTSQAAFDYTLPLLAYPDGRTLVGGFFELQNNGQQYWKLVRLLPNGNLDPGFGSQPFALGSPYRGDSGTGAIYEAGFQPGGNIIIRGLAGFNSSYQGIYFVARLNNSGQLDATFQPAVQEASALHVRPDGRILLGTRTQGGQQPGVTGLLIDGGLDNSFTPLSVQNSSGFGAVNQIVATPNGDFMLCGGFTRVGNLSTSFLARVLPSGAVDPSFVLAPATFQPYSSIFGVAVQPNGRVLVGGLMQAVGSSSVQSLLRLMPNGTLDTAFGLTTQANGSSGTPVIQPNGAILTGGYFTKINNQPHIGLARLLDPNVLHVANRQAEDHTAAWPVPTHGDLHLSLDVASHPRMVQLFDALGREVLRESVSQAETTLATAALAAGVYLLRVDYAAGPVTRRVVVE